MSLDGIEVYQRRHLRRAGPEVAFWNDDYWRYALLAAIALTGASAGKTGVSVADLANQLATLHDIELSDSASDEARPG